MAACSLEHFHALESMDGDWGGVCPSAGWEVAEWSRRSTRFDHGPARSTHSFLPPRQQRIQRRHDKQGEDGPDQ